MPWLARASSMNALASSPVSRWGDHPRDDVTAVDVDDHEQLVVDATFGSAQFRDIPTPNSVGSGGEQFGFLVRGMGALPASLPVLPGDRQQAIHRADAAVVDAVVEELRPTPRRCQIAILRRTQQREDLLTFGFGERVRWHRARRGRPERRWFLAAVVRRAWTAQQTARVRRRVTHAFTELARTI
jgi:hypothetical protein